MKINVNAARNSEKVVHPCIRPSYNALSVDIQLHLPTLHIVYPPNSIRFSVPIREPLYRLKIHFLLNDRTLHSQPA